MKKYLTINNLFIGVAFLTVFAGLSYPFLIKYYFKPNASFIELGTIGDWFGGLSGPIIGFSSFLIVFVAFRLQNKQLNNQRKEFDRQNDSLSLQRFENSFFQLLSFHNEIVQTMWTKYDYKLDIIEERPKKNGNPGEMEKVNLTQKVSHVSDKREYFSNVVLQLKHNLKEIIKNSASLTPQMRNGNSYKESVIIENYKFVYDKEQAKLGHYFRHLYHIVKYVHLSDLIENKDKYSYISILRAQLSAYELVLLMYNCMIEGLGYEKFRFLVDQYDLLQNMNTDLLIEKNDFEIFKKNAQTNDPFTNIK